MNAPRSQDAVNPAVLPGAEPMSHVAPEPGAAGVLTLHGFTGNPSSVRGLAEAFAGAGFHVELPRLPGHGTTVDEMLTTTWDDWAAEVEGAFQRLAARTDRIVLAGLSMGGSLALWTALRHAPYDGRGVPSPRVVGLVLVNPATQPQADEVRTMIGELLVDGLTVVPGVGSDVADPDAVEIAYDGTPLAPLISFLDDGLAPMTGRYAELTMPLLLFTSRQDHVIEPVQSEHLAASYGGPVEHRWLDRSYHVATQDYDKHEIFAGAIEFAAKVTAGVS